MQSFFILFNRYLAERAKGQKMCVSSRVLELARLVLPLLCGASLF